MVRTAGPVMAAKLIHGNRLNAAAAMKQARTTVRQPSTPYAVVSIWRSSSGWPASPLRRGELSAKILEEAPTGGERDRDLRVTG
jgi:hypothetical protein